MALICPNCFSNVPDGALRCPACHADLFATMRIPRLRGTWCATCGALVPDGAEVCPKCGMPSAWYETRRAREPQPEPEPEPTFEPEPEAEPEFSFVPEPEAETEFSFVPEPEPELETEPELEVEDVEAAIEEEAIPENAGFEETAIVVSEEPEGLEPIPAEEDDVPVEIGDVSEVPREDDEVPEASDWDDSDVEGPSEEEPAPEVEPDPGEELALEVEPEPEPEEEPTPEEAPARPVVMSPLPRHIRRDEENSIGSTRAFLVAAIASLVVVGGTILAIAHPWRPSDRSSERATEEMDTSYVGFPGTIESLSGQDGSAREDESGSMSIRDAAGAYEELCVLRDRVESSDAAARALEQDTLLEIREAAAVEALSVAVDVEKLVEALEELEGQDVIPAAELEELLRLARALEAWSYDVSAAWQVGVGDAGAFSAEAVHELVAAHDEGGRSRYAIVLDEGMAAWEEATH